jgi:hypothetical protein
LIVKDSEFVFEPPPVVSRARRVLIKPSAGYSRPYPVTTSREILSVIIDGIRRVSQADILLLEGLPGGAAVKPVYHDLGYKFPRVIMLDVKDCIWVEVDNPLPKPLAVPTFWIPNVILSSDYLITVAPLRVTHGSGVLSLANLLSLLPSTKYGGGELGGWPDLYELGIDRVLTDLYFTLPFDLGIIEASQKFVSGDDPTKGDIEDFGKIFVGEPYEVDVEASEMVGIRTEYLDLIKVAKVGFES